MSVTHGRTQRTTDERAARLEQWCEELIQGFLHERRVDLPRLERHARDAFQRPQERFAGERKIARVVLDIDIPRKERWIDTALLILQCADYKERALFILKPERRDAMSAAVQAAGGLTSDTGKCVAL